MLFAPVRPPNGPAATPPPPRTVRTDHPAPDYDAAVTHLRGLCEAAGMTTAVHTFVPGKPVLLCSRPGTTAGARSVLLNSHTDVVPAEAAKWTVDPFAASDVDGSIYARGVQDMKVRSGVGRLWRGG